MYFQIKVTLIFLTFFFISCNDKKEIETTAIHFHKSYIKCIQSKNQQEVKFIQDYKNQCKIDLKAYISTLKQSTLFSNEFIENEQSRLNNCFEYVNNHSWSEFCQYSLSFERKVCDIIYYYQWYSKHKKASLKIDNIVKEKSYWKVTTGLVYEKQNGDTGYKNNPIIIYIKKVNGEYKVTDIGYK